MCDAASMIENRGRAMGRAMGREIGREIGRELGRNDMASLLNQLFAQNRIEDARKAAADPEYRRQLMQEFAII